MNTPNYKDTVMEKWIQSFKAKRTYIAQAANSLRQTW